MQTITMPRTHWYAAYRRASTESAEMGQDRDWWATALRQDYLMLKRAAERILDSAPFEQQELTGEVDDQVAELLVVDGFRRPSN